MSGSAYPFSCLRSDDEAWARPQSLQPPREWQTQNGASNSYAVSIRDMRQETGVPHHQALDRLATMLEINKVPGPQLFRLKSEFCHPLGRAGGQGAVYSINKLALSKYKRASKSVLGEWRGVDAIAIKRYQRAKSTNPGHGTAEEHLSNRFRDAACEVRALSPRLFRDHPNVVQLWGWGLCLDTLEDPASKCCAFLQVPMLILEKADMNLAEFLQNEVAPPRRRIPDAERGEAASYISRAAPSSVWRWLVSAFTRDTSETIRRLCMDVGHGLGAIHHHKFSHGDLKPENILVFRPGSARGNIEWVAKICDFGHASDENGEPDRNDEVYLGTQYWQPPQDEINGLTPEHKRKCDIYVYGLVVWSAFFNNGQPYSVWDSGNLRAAVESMSDPDLGRRVGELIDTAMKEPATRKMDPWTSLYTESERAHFQRHPPPTEPVSLARDEQEQPRAAPSTDSRSRVYRVPVEAKQGYSNLEWWQNRPPTGGDIQEADMEPSPPTQPQPGSSNLVSRESRDVDDWPLSLDQFTSERRKKDVKDVATKMLQLVAQQSWDQKAAAELYRYARYRSRMPFRWWSECAPAASVLERALALTPAVDISTLAWLTKGEIGKSEAGSLAAEQSVWSSMLENSSIDESERLARMLLLIQAGAPVHRSMSEEGTVLAEYIQSCRSAIVPCAIEQVRRILGAHNGASSDTASISADTRYYITGAGKPQSTMATTLSQDMASMAGLAAPEPDVPTETTGLVGPAGWKAHAVGKRKGLGLIVRHKHDDKLVVYEDKFTGSFTLTKPTSAGSLAQRGEIKIGDLGPNGPRSFISLASLLQGVARTDGGNNPPGDFVARFPIFDEEWFSFEWRTEASSVDLLGSIANPEPWRLPSFTVRIPVLGVMDDIWFGIRWLASSLRELVSKNGFSSFFILLFILSLIAAVVACIALVLAFICAVIGGCLFLIYPNLGMFFLNISIYVMSFQMSQVLALKFFVWGPVCLNLLFAGKFKSAGCAVPFTFLWVYVGAILAVLWIESFCADTPDGVTWDGKECKMCFFVLGGECLPKKT